MSDYLFDLGNTRLKWSAVDSAEGFHAITHHGANPELPEQVRGEAAFVSSVAPDALRVALMTVLATRFRRVHCVRTQARCGELVLGYPEPAQFGVDRFLSLLAIVPAPRPTLVVSIGTALTIDGVLPAGVHLGGVIAPSPALMRAALHDISTKLPAEGGVVTDFASNTLDALASGCESSAIALVKERWNSLGRRAGTPAHCVLHGGGSAMLAEHLPGAVVEQNLVLRGLRVWRDLAHRPRMSE